MPELAEYLPDPVGKNEKRLPDRDFFYKVFNALRPEIVDSIIQQVAQQRKPKGQQLQEQQWALSVKDEWVEQLLQHDFASTKKGYGMSSLLVSRAKDPGTAYKRQKTQSSSDGQGLNRP